MSFDRSFELDSKQLPVGLHKPLLQLFQLPKYKRTSIFFSHPPTFPSTILLTNHNIYLDKEVEWNWLMFEAVLASLPLIRPSPGNTTGDREFIVQWRQLKPLFLAFRYRYKFFSIDINIVREGMEGLIVADKKNKRVLI